MSLLSVVYLLRFRVLFLAIGVSLLQAGASYACSTILLKNESTIVVGHNLDMPGEIPGLLIKNNRGVSKLGVGYDELCSGKTSDRPRLRWISKFGSLTYNPICRDFPDGGINEAGLYIGEMSLDTAEYARLEGKPRLFAANWMQYVLDTCATVADAVETTRHIELNGWGWHFFVADRTGGAAVIEHLDGKIRVFRGSDLPTAALCNDAYESEEVRLKTYEGFGGKQTLDPSKPSTPRFVCAAARTKAFEKEGSPESPITFCFETLAMLDRGSTQWSLVYDLELRVLQFRTARSPKIRTLTVDGMDFGSDSPVLAIDIHADFEGDVTRNLHVLTVEESRRSTQRAIKNLITLEPDIEPAIAPSGRSVADFIDSLVE